MWIPCLDQGTHCLRSVSTRKYQGAHADKRFGSAGLVQALGFKWIICNAEFASRRAADCHYRHPASCGTACADPSNMQSLSLTARSDPSVGTQNLSVRHMGQDNDDPFPSQETVSALVWRHAMPGGERRRWQHYQMFLLGFSNNTVLRRSVREP